MKNTFQKLATGTLAALLVSAIPTSLQAADAPASLIAILTPTAGNDVTGSVTFAQDGDKVTVTAKVMGLEPDSKHGFHIHEFGDISSADGTSAGGHFNPEGHDHALPTTEIRHAGDLGNLATNAEGTAELTVTVDNVSLMEGADAIVGRSVIVHEKADDGGQPTGNAGPRVAMGVIGVANPGDK